MTFVDDPGKIMQRKVSLQALGALTLAMLLCGCGSGGPAAKGAAPSITATTAASAPTISADASDSKSKVPYTDPQLMPIAKADIDLYLDVMQAAAARVQHPPAGDIAAIREWKAYLAKATATSEANAPAQARMEAEQKQLQAQMNAAMQSGDMDKLKALAAQQVQQGQALSQSMQTVTPPDDATSQLAMNLGSGRADEVIVHERHLDADRWDRLVDVIEEIFPPPTAINGDCGGNCTPQLTADQLRREHEHAAGVARNRRILAPYAKQIRALETSVRDGKT